MKASIKKPINFYDFSVMIWSRARLTLNKKVNTNTMNAST